MTKQQALNDFKAYIDRMSKSELEHTLIEALDKHADCDQISSFFVNVVVNRVFDENNTK